MAFEQVVDIVKSTRDLIFDEELRSSVRMKGEADFVTEVDLRVSSYLAERLGELYPQVGFMSEEDEATDLSANRWILDPVDGTTNLVYGYNMSSVSLALVLDHRVAFGVVYNPFNGETFTAERGGGAWCDDVPIHCVDREVPDCIIEFGAGSTRKGDADEAFALAKDVFTHCLDLRRICSSALAICFVAAGRINGYFERQLKPWDIAAATLILEEADGCASTWDNRPAQLDRPDSFVCGSPKAYEFLCGRLPR